MWVKEHKNGKVVDLGQFWGIFPTKISYFLVWVLIVWNFYGYFFYYLNSNDIFHFCIIFLSIHSALFFFSIILHFLCLRKWHKNERLRWFSDKKDKKVACKRACRLRIRFCYIDRKRKNVISSRVRLSQEWAQGLMCVVAPILNSPKKIKYLW